MEAVVKLLSNVLTWVNGCFTRHFKSGAEGRNFQI